MSFEMARRYSDFHIIAQPADLRLNPPESYLYIQDGLIIFSGVLYALCYLFYMARTYKDKTVAGNIEYLSTTMAYEVYYAFTTTSTTFERFCFLVWFIMDAGFVAVAIRSAYPSHRRNTVAGRMAVSTLVGVALLHLLCQYYPDEREQLTAFWTGVLLELPIGWGSVYVLLHRGDTKGQSLEIWITRLLGCLASFAVFIWRYMNVPSNWSYVGSRWSIALMVVTLVPEVIWPFVFLRVYRQQKGKVA
ncbi:hypothetical protein LTR08_005368 [Meristemomyces frigidus]|nr:hypothetical protein LTR08_005368 [Meristemomyces frigidus]